MQTIILAILIIAIGVSNAQVSVPLGNNRYDYKTSSNQYSSSLVEVVACGLNETTFNALLNLIGQGPIDQAVKDWQNRVRVWSGNYWPASSKSTQYTSCQNPQQLLYQFAINSQYATILHQYLLLTLGLRLQISCIDEVMQRQYLTDALGKPGYPQSTSGGRYVAGPVLLRYVYHDSFDWNNVVDKVTGAPVIIPEAIDNCHYMLNDVWNIDQAEMNAQDFGLEFAVGYLEANRRDLGAWIETPDVEVLASIVATEEWTKGPKINFVYGRKQGVCRYKTLKLKNAPSATTWDWRNNLEFQNRQGLTNKQAIAITGAHTLGRNIAQSQGMPFCKTTPSASTISNYTFSFDETPGLFDNNYFKLLANINLNEYYPDCEKTLVYTQNYQPDVFKLQCSSNALKYCNNTLLAKAYMTNLQNVSQFNIDSPSLNPKDSAATRYNKISQLSSDWANLYNPELRGYIQEFANNQSSFFQYYQQAWEIIINTGLPKERQFQCQPVQCAYSSQLRTFTCQNQFEQLEFAADNSPSCSPSTTTTPTCVLNSAFGVKGTITCGSQVFNCPINYGSTLYKNMATQFGADLPKMA